MSKANLMDSDDTPAGRLLRDEIERGGPISLERFMEVALYHAEFGYYRSARDPFGRDGDFFTASQLQPVFGDLIRTVLEKRTDLRSLIDLGAGRGEMRDAFSSWDYRAIDAGDVWPREFTGVVFANELFDALPCRAYGVDGEALIDYRDGQFTWTREPVREECPRAIEMIQRIAAMLTRGAVLIIDYGYGERDRARFPKGTLMSYRRHVAHADVLRAPGTRDITAHVDFDAIENAARNEGFAIAKRTTLATLLLDAGEEAITRASRNAPQQLKTLLFGMGESFDALWLTRNA